MKHSVPKLLLAILFLISAHKLSAQASYGNEWIDYSKTYYKFKVSTDGAVRIQRSTLDAAGLPSTVKGSNFILYREGVEVPVYTSADVMTSSDYIEFWGKKADGAFDKQLYVTPAAQPNDRISLFTDTACYYLTWDANTNHTRYTDATNPIPGTPPAPQSYCIATVGNYFKNAFCGGATYDQDNLFYAASFDQAEGYVENLYNVDVPLSYGISTPNVVTSAPVAARLNTSVVTQSYSTLHDVTVKVNGQLVADSSFAGSATKQYSVSIPTSLLSSNNTVGYANIIPMTPLIIDRYGVSYIEMVYPRNFDVSGLTSFSFKLPGTGNPQYLEFLNYSGAQPRLYDKSNNVWYNGDVSVSGKVRFYVNGAIATREMLLTATAAATSVAVSKKINFTDYTTPSLQGDYVIVTHNALAQPVNGHNYIQEYKDYRSSVSGGGFTSVSVDVTDLYDEFAYGYDIHPLAIRHYLQYAYDKWAQKPAYVNIIGRGILYSQYPAYRAYPAANNFPIVPTYGDPGTDIGFVNFGADKVQKMAVGRVSVWNAAEVGTYLTKIKDYEAALNPASLPSVSSELWKKQALHIASASTDAGLQAQLVLDLAAAGAILHDTLTGYQIFASANNSPGAVNNINDHFVDSLLNSGISMLTYYGHAASSGFQYALNTPEIYHNAPRLPFLFAMGCDVAQMFAISTNGTNTVKTIAERYLLHPAGGAVAVLAADNLGYPGFLTGYLKESYRDFAYKLYGASIGMQIKSVYNTLLASGGGSNINEANLAQLECQIYAGDPAVHLYSSAKPDYHIPSEGLGTIPGNVLLSNDSFKLRIVAYNLARATRDTVVVKVEHKSPGGTTSTVRTYNIPMLFDTDTEYVSIPIDKVNDLGLNKYIVTIDAPNRWDEVSESNNVGVLDLFIYSDNLIPIYPKEFAIVHQQGVTLKASTLNPFRPMGHYKLQLDTTTLFNSPQFMETTVSSMGGVIKWKPNLIMRDSTVYYWRTAFDSLVGGAIQWSNSSFIYLAQGSPGWNQSHYYQYNRDGYDNLDLNTARRFKFRTIDNTLRVMNTIRFANADANSIRNYWNGGAPIQRSTQEYTTVQISVIDSVSGQWWLNSPTNTKGALPPQDPTLGTWTREFPTTDPSYRIAAAKYLQSIPKGDYVIIKNMICHYPGIPYANSPPVYINQWKADTSLASSGGTSLYHAIKDIGFDKIDSFIADKVFILIRKVGDTSFPVTQLFTDTAMSHQILDFSTIVPSFETHGALNGTVIGPATAWQSLKWKYHSADAFPMDDSTTVTIYGIDSNNVETYLCNTTAVDTSLAFISAKKYPTIRMIWGSGDSIIHTAPQLDYWRVLYSPVPEAALNPSAHFAFVDSLHIGQQGDFSVAIENLTDIPMDSMLVRYKIIDAAGSSHLLSNKRYRPLPGNDTLHAWMTFDPAAYPGKDVFFIEANPDGDQREQYHPNNLGYIPFRSIADKSNPLLDVTFDGQHILDGDIVSSKPFIKVLLKDENKYLALDDTSMLTLSMRYPDDPLSSSRKIPFDGTTCKFIPAHIGTDGKNEATIEYRPDHLDDGKYELFVTGKDKSGNTSGLPQGATANAKYQSSFEVINKSTVSNVLNYPNPFSTSTAFVFTLTGSEIPSQFKIQILTVTGRVVREITKQELGPIHIGRNITDYKWDGRDQYGQLLGNGVYMYRVATALNGNDIEHRNSGADAYIKGGWGKMYIMR